jgi:hypothetical protein
MQKNHHAWIARWGQQSDLLIPRPCAQDDNKQDEKNQCECCCAHSTTTITCARWSYVTHTNHHLFLDCDCPPRINLPEDETDILEKVSSKEWKLTKFLESLEWEETIFESLEWEETILESLERKESLRANGFRVLTPFFCSGQVQCSPHIAMIFSTYINMFHQPNAK